MGDMVGGRGYIPEARDHTHTHIYVAIGDMHAPVKCVCTSLRPQCLALHPQCGIPNDN